MNIFINNLFPSLFHVVISNLLIVIGISEFLGIYFQSYDKTI